MRRRRRMTVLAFLSPWLLGVGLFFLYPLVATVYFSFTHYDLLSNPRWVGFSNYQYMFKDDPDFWRAVRNTLWLVVVMVPLRILLGLGVAGIAVSLKSGASLFRSLVYLPYLVPPVASTIAFVFLFNPGTGPVNQILGKLGIPGPGWFTSESWSKPALVLLSLWAIGDLMVIMMAALVDVPRELHEAAAIDGAGQVREVPLRHPPRHLAGGALRRDHRCHRHAAVLHAGERRVDGGVRRDGPAGLVYPARLSQRVDAHVSATDRRAGLHPVQHGLRERAVGRPVSRRDGLHRRPVARNQVTDR